jgi:monoamine oxidase
MTRSFYSVIGGAPVRSREPRASVRAAAEPYDPIPESCLKTLQGRRVAIVGGGFAGLMAARTLCRHGLSVTVYEARAQVGGRVLSTSTFSDGRVIELGAELIGSIHTRWCRLAIEYQLGLTSRMTEELYAGQQLESPVDLDGSLSKAQVQVLANEMRDRVLLPMAIRAQQEVNDPSRPWAQPRLADFDKTTVASWLEKPVAMGGYGVSRKERLWRAMEMFLANNNVAPLDKLNFLGMLCLIRGGQVDSRGGAIPHVGDPRMGYWEELEIYRCADGCQALALRMVQDMQKKSATTKAPIDLRLRHAVTAIRINERATRLGARVDSKVVLSGYKPTVVLAPGKPQAEEYDDVILAAPPTMWDFITFDPDPKVRIGLMNTGPASKHFSDLQERFWIADGQAPLGGSLEMGQVWEGTDNQMLVKGQGIVLNVFVGARSLTDAQFKSGLSKLYRRYGQKGMVKKTVTADWPKEVFIKTGYASPALGQIFGVGQALNDSFARHLYFAGEHTQMDHFGYMEGALRSGERAAHLLMHRACGIKDPEPRRPPPAPPKNVPDDVRVAEYEGADSTP